jgi:hypothetical protein
MMILEIIFSGLVAPFSQLRVSRRLSIKIDYTIWEIYQGKLRLQDDPLSIRKGMFILWLKWDRK